MMPHRNRTVVGVLSLLWVMAACGASDETTASPPTAGQQTAMVTFEPLVSGLEQPTMLTHAGDGTGTLYVVEQPGRVRLVRNGALVTQPFADLADRVLAGGERGLLGLAFHPKYRDNGRVFVSYTRKPDGATVVSELQRAGQTDKVESTGRMILTVPQPYPNHNGGMIAFGLDGFLYIGRGDGGSGGDPGNRAQNPNELLGKILRIDIDRNDVARGLPYAIPADNPFANGGGRPEVFALGLRNPWRFSFDAATGALWVGDVGQDRWEEVSVVTRGGNYGWRLMEAAHCYEPSDGCAREGLTLPVVEYARQTPRCSVIGGYVYRGRAIPSLVGQYLFSDYCSGEIMSAPAGSASGGAVLAPTVIGRTGFNPSSFGVDESGEVYLVNHRGGAVVRLSGRPDAAERTSR
ncbi:MAG: PQQ-dependent sugar dehydrogenase [Nitrospiraceae bacterium]